MKKIYYLLVCMFILSQSFAQTTCIITYALDSSTSNFTFATNAGQANQLPLTNYSINKIHMTNIHVGF